MTIRFFSKNSLTLKLDELYKFNPSVSMFNYINNPTNHRDVTLRCLSINSSHHGYQSRNNSKLSFIRFKRTALQSSFVYGSMRNWNMLPMNQKSTSTSSFKINFKNQFCSKNQSFFLFLLFLLFFRYFSPVILSMSIMFQ